MRRNWASLFETAFSQAKTFPLMRATQSAFQAGTNLAPETGTRIAQSHGVASQSNNTRDAGLH